MSKKEKHNANRRSIIAALAFAGLLASGSYAFTAANTVPGSKAGEGAGSVSGFTLTAIHYNLNASDPTTADSVDFDVDTAPPAGSTLKARVVSGGGWYDCSNAGVAVSCTLTGGVPVASIDTLHFVAAQ